MYLYKYLFKGSKKVTIDLNNTNDIRPDDEINLHLRGRMLSVMEAVWRTFQFPIYPKTFPSVSTIKIQTEGQMRAISQKGFISDCIVYLHRPEELQIFKFKEFFTYFNYQYKKPTRFENVMESIGVYVNDIMNHQFQWKMVWLHPRPIYVFRLLAGETIIRINSVPIDNGELWYMRLLFLHTNPIENLKGMKFYNRIRYNTFQEVAIAMGLVNDIEADNAFNTAMIDSSPAQLRSFFVMLTIQGFPTIAVFNRHKDSILCDDIIENNSNIKFQKLLQDLDERFIRENKDMTNYGLLRKPLLMNTLLVKERVKINIQSATIKLQDLLITQPNTAEMIPIYNQITESIANQQDENDPIIFCITALGGSGKSTMAKNCIIILTV